MIKNASYYLKKSIAFFDLKARNIPPLCFVILLALSAMTNALPIDNILYDTETGQIRAFAPYAVPVRQLYLISAVALAVALFTKAVSMIYLSAAIRDASNADYTGRDCVCVVIKKFVRLIGMTIVKYFIGLLCIFPMLAVMYLYSRYPFSLFIFIPLLLISIIPVIYFSIMFFFAESSILNNNCKKVFQSLKFSRDLTKGRRGEIFRVMAFCVMIVFIFIILLLLILSAIPQIVYQFTIMFIFTIIALMQQKLTAYLYVDILSAYEEQGGKSAEL